MAGSTGQLAKQTPVPQIQEKQRDPVPAFVPGNKALALDPHFRGLCIRPVNAFAEQLIERPLRI